MDLSHAPAETKGLRCTARSEITRVGPYVPEMGKTGGAMREEILWRCQMASKEPPAGRESEKGLRAT